MGDVVLNIQTATSADMARAVMVPLLLLLFFSAHMYMAGVSDKRFEDPSDDDVALQLYFWDVDPDKFTRSKTWWQLLCDCCKRSHKKNPEVEVEGATTAFSSVLRRLKSDGVEAAEEHLETILL